MRKDDLGSTEPEDLQRNQVARTMQNLNQPRHTLAMEWIQQESNTHEAVTYKASLLDDADCEHASTNSGNSHKFQALHEYNARGKRNNYNPFSTGYDTDSAPRSEIESKEQVAPSSSFSRSIPGYEDGGVCRRTNPNIHRNNAHAEQDHQYQYQYQPHHNHQQQQQQHHHQEQSKLLPQRRYSAPLKHRSSFQVEANHSTSMEPANRGRRSSADNHHAANTFSKLQRSSHTSLYSESPTTPSAMSSFSKGSPAATILRRQSKSQSRTPDESGQRQHIHHHQRVQVSIRCRPASPNEAEVLEQIAAHGTQMPLHITTANTPTKNVQQEEQRATSKARVVLKEVARQQNREFHFDQAFKPETTQFQVYQHVAEPVVNDVLRGYNGTILAYGQTGSGKTHTMGIIGPVFDSSADAGIIPRTLDQIFTQLESEHKHRHATSSDDGWSLTLSFVQIYNDMVQDLLAPVGSGTTTETSLPVREDPSKGFYVEGVVKCAVADYAESLAVLNAGLENRKMAATVMNTCSSRSHTLLSVEVVHNGTQGKLLLVDLAGSERVSRTASKGVRLLEARRINGSLSALGNVVAALADKRRAHVRFRDCKLTKLLQETLSGRARAALVATVSPAEMDVQETLSTLQFAARCMHVPLAPVVNHENDSIELCAFLQLRLSRVEAEHRTILAEQRTAYETRIVELENTLFAASQNFDTKQPDVTGNGYTAVAADGARLNSSNVLTQVQQTDTLTWCAKLSEHVLGVVRNCMMSSAELWGKWEDITAKEEAMLADQQGLTEVDTSRRMAWRVKARKALQEQFSGVSIVKAQQQQQQQKTSVEDDLLAPTTRPAHTLAQLETQVTKAMVLMSDKAAQVRRCVTALRNECLDQRVEHDSREDELVNWSHILKYLLATNARLRQQVREARSATHFSEHSSSSSSSSSRSRSNNSAPRDSNGDENGEDDHEDEEDDDDIVVKSMSRIVSVANNIIASNDNCYGTPERRFQGKEQVSMNEALLPCTPPPLPPRPNSASSLPARCTFTTTTAAAAVVLSKQGGIRGAVKRMDRVGQASLTSSVGVGAVKMAQNESLSLPNHYCFPDNDRKANDASVASSREEQMDEDDCFSQLDELLTSVRT